jgi:hypothetical protein
MKHLKMVSVVTLAIVVGLHLLYVYLLKDQCDIGFTAEECAQLPHPKIFGIWEP